VHEFALADAVVKTALGAAREAGITEIERIVVKVGELQQIQVDLFEFSLSQVLPEADPALAGVEFEVLTEPARFSCRPCGAHYGREELVVGDDPDRGEAVHFVPELAHAFVRCPDCGSPDFEIETGRGVTLEQVVGRDEGPG
jgi:hydrogenase nickel incorporation protein HypA/HybF